MEFKYLNIDPKTSSKEEIKAEIARLDALRAGYEGNEQAIKIFINSVYGASASPYFAGYNIRVAEAITLQGQEMDKFAIKIMNRYFQDFWYKDKEAHDAMGIKGPVQKVTQDVVVYADTDSVAADSIITTNTGKHTIEKLYNLGTKNKGNTLAGHESVSCDMLIENWSKEKGVYFAKPERIIRHKVYKKKYKIKTSSGKEIFVTGDHSLILFKDDKQFVGTVKDIVPGVKVLTVYD
jgi:hypothetical protein